MAATLAATSPGIQTLGPFAFWLSLPWAHRHGPWLANVHHRYYADTKPHSQAKEELLTVIA